MPDNLREMTLGEIEEYIRSLDFGALTGYQYAQIFRIMRMALTKTRNQLPAGAFWKRIAIGTAIHALAEVEEDIKTWTQTPEND